MINIDNNQFHIGLVKWFGGYNHQKEKENDFGFIESILGEDLFIHKNEIKDDDSLDDGELVIFEVEEKKGKSFAKNLFRPQKNNKVSSYVLPTYLKNISINSDAPHSYRFEVALRKLIDKNLIDENIPFLKSLGDEAKNSITVYSLIDDSINWYQLFRLTNRDTPLINLLQKGFPLHLIPPEFIKSQEESYYSYVKGLESELRNKFFKDNIENLPIYLVLASVLESILVDEKLIRHRFNELKELIENKFREVTEPFPEYLDVIYKLNKNDYKLNPTLHKILEPILLKRRLHNKDINLKQYFEQSTYLRENAESFILTQLFSLILAKNSLDITYQIFSHNLWLALVDESIDINSKDVLTLFPACRTLGYSGLSCEAFYWPKTEKYICRGRVCLNPQVKPDTLKHYLDFNIYDWFSYYGVDYINDGEPSQKDFPIKLAGYFNRLKEIFNILHCRECNKLMKPNMKYARTEYIDYESGEPVRKSMFAAKRVTVFKCGNNKCTEHENSYYINHCLGFGCESIIDTRDLKQKCDSSLYICKGCGSCCEQHAKTNSIGSCPDCGSHLDLFENTDKVDQYGKYERFVRCSNQICKFEITDNLPKKFFLPSCQPVKSINPTNIQF